MKTSKDPVFEQIQHKKIELIDNYKQKQDLQKLQMAQLRTQIQEKQMTIKRQCKSIDDTMKKIRQKAKEKIIDFTEALKDDSKSHEIIDIKDLAGYLKLQKGVLKQLSQTKVKQKPEGDLDIHKMLGQAKFEKSLKTLKRKQIEEEIKYLETNVLLKGNLIYNAAAATPVSNSQEKQLNLKIQNAINQLERVVTLNSVCNGIQDTDSSSKLFLLENQTKRLKQCEGILNSEAEKLSKLMKFFQSQSYSLLQKLPLPLYDQMIQSKQTARIETSQTVTEAELDEIINYELPEKRLIGTFEHKFDSYEEEIELVRKKFRKIQKLR